LLHRTDEVELAVEELDTDKMTHVNSNPPTPRLVLPLSDHRHRQFDFTELSRTNDEVTASLSRVSGCCSRLFSSSSFSSSLFRRHFPHFFAICFFVFSLYFFLLFFSRFPFSSFSSSRSSVFCFTHPLRRLFCLYPCTLLSSSSASSSSSSFLLFLFSLYSLLPLFCSCRCLLLFLLQRSSSVLLPLSDHLQTIVEKTSDVERADEDAEGRPVTDVSLPPSQSPPPSPQSAVVPQQSDAAAPGALQDSVSSASLETVTADTTLSVDTPSQPTLLVTINRSYC